jgi:hypothetical protein
MYEYVYNGRRKGGAAVQRRLEGWMVSDLRLGEEELSGTWPFFTPLLPSPSSRHAQGAVLAIGIGQVL